MNRVTCVEALEVQGVVEVLEAAEVLGGVEVLGVAKVLGVVEVLVFGTLAAISSTSWPPLSSS